MNKEWTTRMIENLLDGLDAVGISDYLYCPNCRVMVDSFVLSMRDGAPHFCELCGFDISPERVQGMCRDWK